MWTERLKQVALWLSFMILLLLDIWIYTVLYFWSRSYRMSFYVIGNWIMSEKVCLGIYILAALLCNIALYLRPFGKLCIKIISVLFGPVLLLLTITCFACGDIMILTTFFLFFLYIMFWGVQTIWLLVVGKFKKKYLYVLLQKIGTGTIIFLLVGALCSFEHNLRNMYELSIGLQTYGKISAAYIDNQNLSAWEMHDKLSNVQRQEIYQKLIDSECQYLGIDPVKVKVNDEFGQAMDGYYDSETRMITITECGMDKGMVEVINILCHEVYHAYSFDLVETFKKIDCEDKELLVFRRMKELEVGFEYYNKSGSYEEYYYNPVEIYARSYAKSRMEEYCQFLSVGEK